MKEFIKMDSLIRGVLGQKGRTKPLGTNPPQKGAEVSPNLKWQKIMWFFPFILLPYVFFLFFFIFILSLFLPSIFFFVLSVSVQKMRELLGAKKKSLFNIKAMKEQVTFSFYALQKKKKVVWKKRILSLVLIKYLGINLIHYIQYVITILCHVMPFLSAKCLWHHDCSQLLRIHLRK